MHGIQFMAATLFDISIDFQPTRDNLQEYSINMRFRRDSCPLTIAKASLLMSGILIFDAIIMCKCPNMYSWETSIKCIWIMIRSIMSTKRIYLHWIVDHNKLFCLWLWLWLWRSWSLLQFGGVFVSFRSCVWPLKWTIAMSISLLMSLRLFWISMKPSPSMIK